LKASIGNHLGHSKSYGVEECLRYVGLYGWLGVLGEDLERESRRFGYGMLEKLGESKSIKPL
jgi:hypothetical protein